MRNRRIVTIAAAVFLAVLTVFSPFPTATAATPYYAAYAYGITGRTVAYGTGTNPVEAQAAAELACRNKGGSIDCQGVGWWTNTWSAFAIGSSTSPPTAWGWGWNTVQATADSTALSHCGGSSAGCNLIYRLGIGGTATNGDNLSPVRGNWRVGGYGQGQGDHVGRDYWAVDFFSDQNAVYPLRPGRVVFSGWNCQTVSGQPPCYGYVVAVDHGGGLYSVYTHLAATELIAVGTAVNSQTRIGTMSDSGCSGCGVHLHVAMRSGPLNLGSSALFGSNTPVRTPWR